MQERDSAAVESRLMAEARTTAWYQSNTPAARRRQAAVITTIEAAGVAILKPI
jgi:hypothetical protein